jgi:serine/threonine protein kinase/Tfp pilus assembly protein PilF
LIYEEICLRQETGQESASVEVVQRFPQWREQLQDILCHAWPRRPSPPRFPEMGETLGGFRMLAELGHGIRGRVFLAVEPALADRPVILKITSCDGGEHLSLARLQHTHIVPLYAVQDFVERNLRLLCMPYFGGATLAQIFERLRGRRLDELKGQDLLYAIDQAQQEGIGAESLGGASPVRQILAQLSYTRAICWIGSCLADALEYAHQRALVHLDLKPSNVLLAADGQPMLLDFHLAQQPLLPDGPPPTWLGGTPAYMSPEQIAAIAAMRDRRSVATPVDGRSDIYSLGVLLNEALGGHNPNSSSSPKPAEKPISPIAENAQVTPSLADLIGKCLQPQPQDRYQRAADLAADLRRYLGDLPLVGVRNRSLAERWKKWRRRRPHALAFVSVSLAFFAVAGAAGGSALVQILQWYEDARHYLETGQEQMSQGDLDKAKETFTRGLSLAAPLPFGHDLQRDLAAHLQLAREKKSAWNFHNLAEKIRFKAVADSLTNRDLQDLEASCRAARNSLPLIATRLADLENEERQKIRTDFLDLVILEADLHVRLAIKSDQRPARQFALQILEDAETAFGPSPVLCRERQVHAEAMGLTRVARRAAAQTVNLPPTTSWERCVLGRSHLQSGNLDAAVREFKEAVDLEPGSLWPNYYLGVCAYRVGHAKDALQAFSVCLGAAGQMTGALEDGKLAQAQILYNRALALTAAGSIPEAIEDYNRALNLDAHFGKARLNRGILHLNNKNYDQAIADLKQALENGVPPALIHYNLALVYKDQNKPQVAITSAREALKFDPAHKEAQALLKQLTAQPSK